MYEVKGIITEDEQILISSYPEGIQERLKEKLLAAKHFSSYSYDRWIEIMEQGIEINFSKQDKVEVITFGKPNISRVARVLLEVTDGISRTPFKSELEHDGRLEEFKQFPKGTRVKANGEYFQSES